MTRARISSELALAFSTLPKHGSAVLHDDVKSVAARSDLAGIGGHVSSLEHRRPEGRTMSKRRVRWSQDRRAPRDRTPTGYAKSPNPAESHREATASSRCSRAERRSKRFRAQPRDIPRPRPSVEMNDGLAVALSRRVRPCWQPRRLPQVRRFCQTLDTACDEASHTVEGQDRSLQPQSFSPCRMGPPTRCAQRGRPRCVSAAQHRPPSTGGTLLRTCGRLAGHCNARPTR